MPRTVIVAYTPKPGREEELLTLVRRHIHVLREEGLVTDRDPWVMRAADGSFVEVFSWRSPEAIEAAHTNEAVGALWGAFAEVCDYRPVSSLAEAGQLFSEFEEIAL